jgi:bacillolysin
MFLNNIVGTEDNGGVHFNSGIPNYAYYLFVQELRKSRTEEEAKKIAERVFYHTLANFLTRSSVFKDLRIGVERSAVDLYFQEPRTSWQVLKKHLTR